MNRKQCMLFWIQTGTITHHPISQIWSQRQPNLNWQITKHKSQLSVNNWVASHNSSGTKWKSVEINLEVKNKEYFYCTSKGIVAPCDLYWSWTKQKSLNITTRSACLANRSISTFPDRSTPWSLSLLWWAQSQYSEGYRISSRGQNSPNSC